MSDLSQLDSNLRQSGMERMAVEFALEGLPAGTSASSLGLKAEFAIYALRAELLRDLLGLPSFEAFWIECMFRKSQVLG